MTHHRNRNKIRQWFITYPQWKPDQKETILKFFQRNYNLVYYKIAQESHEDGNPHYHIIIKIDEGITKSSLLSLLKEEYPADNKRIDVKAIRSLKASVQYLSKEDDQCLEHPDGYIETRQPLQHIYKKALLDWANYLGYETIEDYENSPRFLKFSQNPVIS